MLLIFTIILSLLFAWLSRMCGGGWPKLPWGLDQHIYAVPYALVGALAFGSSILAISVAAALSYAGAFLGKRTGHGNFMDLATWGLETHGDERLEFLIKPLKNKISRYWYDFIGLSLTGSVCALPCSIFVALLSPVLGAAIFLGGAAKGVAYAIGWKLFPDNRRGRATVTGELLTGFFGGLPLFYSLGVLLHVG